MRKFFINLLSTLPLLASANDGVFFVSGNQLVPVHETDIAVSKEVLTIGLSDNGFASVDVYYEFMNRGQEKTVQMGFEAEAPYNDGEPFSPQGIHPHIKDFVVEMNGQPLSYRNAVVATTIDGDTEFQPMDLSRWKVNDEPIFSRLPSSPAGTSCTIPIAIGCRSVWLSAFRCLIG